MDSVKPRRGFLTIATGNERYYKMALALLHSYRLHASDDTPFGLLCDREWELTQEFDDVVVMEHCHSSYMDKLQLAQYSPYEETIFIDADALFLQNPSVLWEDFLPMPDFSCYGQVLPRDSMLGWYDCSKLGELTPLVEYNIGLHGGLYYFRKTEFCLDIFHKAKKLADNFSQYRFLFCSKPADEPVLALAMALAKIKPCPFRDRIAFVPSMEGTLRIRANGTLLVKNKPGEQVILHFANGNTTRFMYCYLTALIEERLKNGADFCNPILYWKLRLRHAPSEFKYFCKHKKNKLMHWLHKTLSPEIWRKLRKLIKGR